MHRQNGNTKMREFCLSQSFNMLCSVNYTCEDGWRLHKEYCYLFSYEESDWQNAEDYCRRAEQYYGHLISIHDQDEQSFIAGKHFCVLPTRGVAEVFSHPTFFQEILILSFDIDLFALTT